MASYGWIRVTKKDIISQVGNRQGELWEVFYLAISGRVYTTIEGVTVSWKMLGGLLPEGYAASIIRVNGGWQVILRRRP